MPKHLFFFIFLFFSFFGCKSNAPADFSSGEFQCDNCGMIIVDEKFKSEILTLKGKIKRFDDICCMLRWKEENFSEIKSVWLIDFHANHWISIEDAYILKSEKLRSPMSSGMAAFGSSISLNEATREFGGKY